MKTHNNFFESTNLLKLDSGNLELPSSNKDMHPLTTN